MFEIKLIVFWECNFSLGRFNAKISEINLKCVHCKDLDCIPTYFSVNGFYKLDI